MTTEGYRRVGELYHAALELAPEARPDFLARACGDESELRGEVESLLQAREQAEGFISAKVAGVIAELAAEQSASLVGCSLGHYRALSLIGAGGMGRVYLAEDTRLGRKVALKLLPPTFTRDQERVLRFQQEARAASSLNHPNILTIHEIVDTATAEGAEVSAHFIVSEFVEGETLRAMLGRGPLELGQAAAIASQVAGALKVAHEAGIVHRDIKPENVMVRPDGLVKVLDFGLAKLTEDSRGDKEMGEENRTYLSLTFSGVVMGTLRYMSPEQARGQKVDRRTDIFSLGVVLYEMITGRRPFEGPTTSDVIVALLTAEPPALRQYRAEAATELEEILGRCLAKDADARYQSAGELCEDLKALAPGSRSKKRINREAQARRQRSRSWRWPLLAAAALSLILVLAWSLVRWRAPQPGQINERGRPTNSAAYEHYLRGRYYANRQIKTDNETAIAMLERAVALDPNFAAAHAELAQAYVWRFFLFTPNEKVWEEKAFVEVEKALSLDPDLAVAYQARGRLLWTPANHFPHEKAIRDYRRALALDQSLGEAQNQLALVLIHIGAFDQAHKELQKAVTVNPTNSLAQFRIGETLVLQGKYDEALTALGKAPNEANPSLTEFSIALALIHLGRREEAAARVADFTRGSLEDGGLFAGIQALLASLDGKNDRAEAKIGIAIEQGRGFGHFHHTTYNIACAYSIMKNPDEAIRWLRKTADGGFPCYPLFESDPYLNNLRKDPRFRTLIVELRKQWERFQ